MDRTLDTARLRREVWNVGPIDCGSGSAPARADVVVVGGGVMGLSIAISLAAGGRRVVLAEKVAVGHGASGRNAGLYLPSLQPLESMDHLHAFLTNEAADVDYREAGHLALASDPDTAKAFADEAERHRETPPAVRVLDPAQIAAVTGVTVGQGVSVGRWYVAGGQLNPWHFLAALVAAARRRRVVVLECWPVGAIEEGRSNGLTVTGVAGEIRADHVVLAAGAWTTAILPPFAAPLPLRVRPAQMFATAADPTRLPGPGMAEGFGSTYWRVGPGGRIVAGGRAQLDRPSTTPDAFTANPAVQNAVAADITRLDTRASGVIPALGWAGAFDVTLDGAPMVGPVDANRRLWVVCGFGGHGLPLALGIGRYVADRLSNRECAEDPWLNPRRFHKRMAQLS